MPAATAPSGGLAAAWRTAPTSSLPGRGMRSTVVELRPRKVVGSPRGRQCLRIASERLWRDWQVWPVPDRPHRPYADSRHSRPLPGAISIVERGRAFRPTTTVRDRATRARDERRSSLRSRGWMVSGADRPRCSQGRPSRSPWPHACGTRTRSAFRRPRLRTGRETLASADFAVIGATTTRDKHRTECPLRPSNCSGPDQRPHRDSPCPDRPQLASTTERTRSADHDASGSHSVHSLE